nr:hypothetical protein [Tanacetum cinerariifolium]
MNEEEMFGVNDLDSDEDELTLAQILIEIKEAKPKVITTAATTVTAADTRPKVFANMKREGKDFSRKVTPLFATMMVQAPEDIGEGLEIPTDTHHTRIVTQPSSSLPQKKQKSRRKQRKEIEVPSPSSGIPTEEGVPTTSNDLLPSGEDRMQLNELMILCK